jgi:hypothetical protein
MSPSKLYPEQSPRLRAEDYAWIASGLTEAGISTVGVDMATKEIAAAQAAVEKDKSEANLERLEQAHNMLALAQAAQRFGLLVAGGRAIGAWKKPYQSSRPDIAAAEAERARILEHLSRVKQPKSPLR